MQYNTSFEKTQLSETHLNQNKSVSCGGDKEIGKASAPEVLFW